MTSAKTQFSRLLFTLFIIFLAGCQSTVYLMPTPAGMQSGKHDPFEYTPDRHKGSYIAVVYATNRLPSDSGNYYAREFDNNLRVGVTQVQIGDGKQGWEEIRRLSINGLDKKDAELAINGVTQTGIINSSDSIDILSPEHQVYMDILNKAIDESHVKEITVYVHGANNSFYRSAAQAAQYRHFTGRHAIVTFFSWPSAENILRYGTDVSNIEETVPTFARYLKFLARHSSAERINILCYSVGATLTTRTLALLGNDHSQPDREAYRESLRLGSVYFAAPDTDFDHFIEEYRQYEDIVDRVTVTINHDDSVLGVSRRMFHARGGPKTNNQQLKSSKSRLGKPDIKDLTQAQADWIIEKTRDSNFDVLEVDYNAIPGLSKGSHDYWYQNPWTSTDALLTLNFHASPQERALISRESENAPQIWYFPEDYDTRIDDALEQIPATSK
jgi:esterase/lipase superfamily enzyme